MKIFCDLNISKNKSNPNPRWVWVPSSKISIENTKILRKKVDTINNLNNQASLVREKWSEIIHLWTWRIETIVKFPPGIHQFRSVLSQLSFYVFKWARKIRNWKNRFEMPKRKKWVGYDKKIVESHLSRFTDRFKLLFYILLMSLLTTRNDGEWEIVAVLWVWTSAWLIIVRITMNNGRRLSNVSYPPQNTEPPIIAFNIYVCFADYIWWCLLLVKSHFDRFTTTAQESSVLKFDAHFFNDFFLCKRRNFSELSLSEFFLFPGVK